MCGAEEPAEKETYDLVAKTLSHPIRRRILRLLDEKGQMRFSDLRDAVSIDKSQLAYHLVQLGELVKKTDQGYYVLSRPGDISISLMKNVEKSGETLSNAKDERYSKLLDEYERLSRSLPLSLTGEYSKAAKDDLEREIERTKHYFNVTREEAIGRIYSDFFEPPIKRDLRSLLTIQRFGMNRWGTMLFLFSLAVIMIFYVVEPDYRAFWLLAYLFGMEIAYLSGILMDQYNLRNRLIVFVGMSCVFGSTVLYMLYSYSSIVSVHGPGLVSLVWTAIQSLFGIWWGLLIALGLLRAYRGNHTESTS